MKKAVFSEYIGVVDTDLLLQNLSDKNPTMLTFPATSPEQAFKGAFPRGFIVVAQIEMSIPETHEEQRGAIESFQARIARGETLEPPGRKLGGLTLTPFDS